MLIHLTMALFFNTLFSEMPIVLASEVVADLHEWVLNWSIYNCISNKNFHPANKSGLGFPYEVLNDSYSL